MTSSRQSFFLLDFEEATEQKKIYKNFFRRNSNKRITSIFCLPAIKVVVIVIANGTSNVFIDLFSLTVYTITIHSNYIF